MPTSQQLLICAHTRSPENARAPGRVSPETTKLYTHFNTAESKKRMESLETGGSSVQSPPPGIPYVAWASSPEARAQCGSTARWDPWRGNTIVSLPETLG